MRAAPRMATPKKPNATHANDKSWKKGQSGNPGGRSPRIGPNGETLTQLCRGHTADLVKRAYDIAMNTATEPKDALVAIFGLLDRGWGKPKGDDDDGSKKEDMASVLSKMIDKLPG